jgi:hypothetical protein
MESYHNDIEHHVICDVMTSVLSSCEIQSCFLERVPDNYLCIVVIS